MDKRSKKRKLETAFVLARRFGFYLARLGIALDIWIEIQRRRCTMAVAYSTRWIYRLATFVLRLGSRRLFTSLIGSETALAADNIGGLFILSSSDGMD